MDIKEQSLELDQCKKALQGEIILCDSLRAENQALKAEIESLKSLSLVKVLEQKYSVIVKQEECNDWLRAENARLQAIINMNK